MLHNLRTAPIYLKTFLGSCMWRIISCKKTFLMIEFKEFLINYVFLTLQMFPLFQLNLALINRRQIQRFVRVLTCILSVILSRIRGCTGWCGDIMWVFFWEDSLSHWYKFSQYFLLIKIFFLKLSLRFWNFWHFFTLRELWFLSYLELKISLIVLKKKRENFRNWSQKKKLKN